MDISLRKTPSTSDQSKSTSRCSRNTALYLSRAAKQLKNSLRVCLSNQSTPKRVKKQLLSNFQQPKEKKNEHDPEGSSAINLSRKERGEQTGIRLSSTEEPTFDFLVTTGCTLYIVLYEH